MIWWAIENTLVVGLLGLVIFAMTRIWKSKPAMCHMLWLVVLVKLITPPFALGAWPPSEMRDQITANISSYIYPESKAEIDPYVLEQKSSYVDYSWEKEAEKQAEYEKMEQEAKKAEDKSDGKPAELKLNDSYVAKTTTPTLSMTPQETVTPSGDTKADTVTTNTAGFNPLPFIGYGLFAIWLLGSLIFAAMYLRRCIHIRKLATQTTAAPHWLVAKVRQVAEKLGVEAPEVCISEIAGSPLISAIGKPKLVWPVTLLDENAGHKLNGIITHELAHIKRRDHLVAWLELLAACVWWWNPVQWWVRNRLRHEAELACDAWAVWLQPENRRVYAEALIEVTAQNSFTPVAVPALSVTSNCRAFERRLAMIMKERSSHRVSPQIAIAAGLLGLMVLPSWSQGSWEAPAVTPVVFEGGEIDPSIKSVVKMSLLKQKGLQARNDSDWKSVAKIYSAIAEAEPENGNAFHWKGYSLIAIGETVEAREAFINEIELGDAVHRAAYNIACTYALEENSDKAMKYLGKAYKAGFTNSKQYEGDSDLASLREDQRFENLMDNIANSNWLEEEAKGYYENKEYENAAVAYAKLSEQHPYTPRYMEKLGYSRIFSKDAKGSLEAFKTQLELEEEFGGAGKDVLYNIACCYSLMENPEPALTYLSKSIDAGWYDLKHIEKDTDLDNIRDSEGFRNVISRLEENNSLKKEAYTAFEEQNWSAAIVAFTTLIEENPDWGKAYHQLGFAQHQLGNYDDAIASWTTEIQCGNNLSTSLYNISCAYSMKGNGGTAIEYLGAAVKCGFNNAELMEKDSDLDNIRDNSEFEKILAVASTNETTKKEMTKKKDAEWEGEEKKSEGKDYDKKSKNDKDDEWGD